jgi:hypothetical protein
MGGAQDAGSLRHKVNAAEDDVLAFGPGCRLLGKQERIPLKVGIFDDFFPLVVVSQNRRFGTQLFPGLVYSFI